MEIHEFNPTIYPFLFWVIIDKTPKGIPNKFNGYDGKPIINIESDTSNSEAFTMPVRQKHGDMYGVLIFFRSKKSMKFKLVTHECSHAAKFLFEHINADVKEHEPFEYVIGWMAGCCEKVKFNRKK